MLASENSFYITDLNNNGKAETSIIYYLSCRSDTSPSTMKFIMKEGRQKFALRGKSILEPYLLDMDTVNFNPKLDKSFDGNYDGTTEMLLQIMVLHGYMLCSRQCQKGDRLPRKTIDLTVSQLSKLLQSRT